ncbi:hypothetical protein KKD19_04995 [Patescibacteria group bacterium]|nr:hypothetical protein [Patescibacteria group bacterium]MBU4512566.1 hypothetical protein [Patescibacteria group bacterium]
MKKLTPIIGLILLFTGIILPYTTSAQESAGVNFFYSQSCPHCRDEQKFLDAIEEKYPDVIINRYLIDDPNNQALLKELAGQCGAERYLGLVPMTFVGENFFLGFDNAEGKGKEIETAIQEQSEAAGQSSCPPLCSCSTHDAENYITLPVVGEINIQNYSLPAMAVVLGLLDGFNVCSLGALILILSLVLALRSRRKILIYGGLFILTTAIVYGLLITLWYQIFALLSPYLKIMEILIGLLGIGGGIYFLKQFIKFKKQGPTCEIGAGQKIMSRFSGRLKESLGRPGNVLAVIGSVLLFAAVITIVEFPCSAVVPVVYAGVLSNANLSFFGYLLYIALFILFYMLDELIVFLLAFFKMSVWMTSGKFVTWMALVGSIILFLLGFYYLVGF